MAALKLQPSVARTLAEASVALTELRDSLMELQLALKDLQFETDREQRKKAGQTVRDLLARIGSAQGPPSL